MVFITQPRLTWLLCSLVHVAGACVCLVAGTFVCLGSIFTCATCSGYRHVRPRKVLQFGSPVVLLCLLGLLRWWSRFTAGPIRVDAPPQAFEARLEAALRGKETLTAAQVAAAEDQILSFDIPQETLVILEAPDGVPLMLHRWMQAHTGRCPRCRVTTTGRASAVERQQSRVKLLMGCPTAAAGQIVRDHPEQVLVCGCGEAQTSEAARLYYRGLLTRFQTAGVALCDYATSFNAPRGTNGFHTSYSHLHFTPPRMGAVYSVAAEAQRFLNTTRATPLERAPSVFIHSNCGAEPRSSFVRNLINLNHSSGLVDRWGACWNNRNLSDIQPPNVQYWNDGEGNRDTVKTDVLSRYAFAFALENSLNTNYFTEKRYQALAAGAVPIVWKNDNSVEHLPAGAQSAIFPEDDDMDPDRFAARLLALSPQVNATAYNELHAWKQKGIQRDFVQLMFESHDFLICRLCERFASRALDN